MAASTGVGGNREGSAKATVAEQISQAVQSTSNLLHLMQESSPAQIMQVVIIGEDTIDSSSRAHGALLENQKASLIRLPKNLLAKASVTKNTGQILEHLPHVISSLDGYMESSLQSASHLKTVSQLLSNMESSQLKPSFPLHQHRDEQKDPDSEEIVKVT